MNIYWKQFAAWVTDLRNKYSGDIFFRTELNVVALQIGFAIVISIFLLTSFNYLYKDILQTLIQGITENIRSNGSVNGQDIFNSIQLVKAKNFVSFFIVTISITLIFSYVIAKITLTPARNALKSQKRFISDIAHELRTPLSIIKTNNEVALLDERRGSSRDILESNIEELDRASAIINNLLSFSNLIRPEQIRFSQVDMGKVVDTAVNKMEDLSRSKNVSILVKKTNPAAVLGNITALEQISINLLKNAIDYTSKDGRVTIEVRPDYNGFVTLSVEDNGIGISEKDLLHIFEPFYRVDKARNRKTGNTGLGLTIVSELVKLHGGKVSIKSKLNNGTTVVVSLPYWKENLSESKNENILNKVSIDFNRN